MIHIFGDSITAGVPGVSFCRYFKIYRDYKKYGIGGDTVIGLNNRIHIHEFSLEDTYIIEIGTNDILLDHLYETSSSWKNTIRRIERTGRIFSKDEKEFSKVYASLLKKLGHRKAIIISIPCIGEDIESKTNKKVDAYNTIIEHLCKNAGKVYLDFNKWQKVEISSLKRKNIKFISNHPVGMIVDVMLTKYFFLSDILSKRRNLCTTIDGVHLNSNGASMLAKMIEDELKNIA